jgi:AcrR family transcriptional regulator
MDAGLELFGTVGYPHTSVRAICSAARLNPRYFYESFDNREDLLFAVYQRVADDLFNSVREAAAGQETIEGQARATVQAAWNAVTDDPRKAKVLAVEVVGVSNRLERVRRETRQALAQLTADNARSLAGPDLRLRLDSTLVARFLMGGVVEILLEWINGDLDASADEVVEHFTVLFTAAAVASIAAPD